MCQISGAEIMIFTFKITAIKQQNKQTSLKQKECNISQGSKMETLKPGTVVHRDSKTKWNVNFVQCYCLVICRNSVPAGALCTNSAEQRGFCTAKIFTLEEFITLWGSAIEVPLYFIMPSNYVSDISAKSVVLKHQCWLNRQYRWNASDMSSSYIPCDIGAKSVINISGSEELLVTVMLVELADDAELLPSVIVN
jgi:hypothetical protein